MPIVMRKTRPGTSGAGVENWRVASMPSEPSWTRSRIACGPGTSPKTAWSRANAIVRTMKPAAAWPSTTAAGDLVTVRSPIPVKVTTATISSAYQGQECAETTGTRASDANSVAPAARYGASGSRLIA